MIRTTDIHSLTDFQRNSKSLIQKVTQTKNPIAITVNGEPEVVMQDARVYQEMVDELERVKLISTILEGEADIEAGRVREADEFFEELSRKHGFQG